MLRARVCRRLSINSDRREGQSLIKQILKLIQEFEWSEKDLFAVHLAIEECLVNAIEHGNKDNIFKSIHVSLRISFSRIIIKIRDEGQGFDPTKVPDPTDDEYLDLPRGRGLLLMRRLMNHVSFNATGTTVKMIKCRTVE